MDGKTWYSNGKVSKNMVLPQYTQNISRKETL